jgi:hypothetical protein
MIMKTAFETPHSDYLWLIRISKDSPGLGRDTFYKNGYLLRYIKQLWKSYPYGAITENKVKEFVNMKNKLSNSRINEIPYAFGFIDPPPAKRRAMVAAARPRV